MGKPINGFFAYPSNPHAIPEIIKSAVKEINKSQECQIKTWEECSISGKIIIDVICRAIDNSDLFIADLTGANPNVLFELGYAIGKNKRVWLVLDTSIQESKTLYDQLKILTTVGYSPYSNSQNIIDEFFKEHPWTDLDDTIFKNSIKPSLDSREKDKLLYLKNQHETEASTQVDRTIQSFLIPFTISDPRESSVHTLVWYGTKICSSPGVIAHFSGESRRGYRLHNSRYAFVSGLAHGLEKPLLMLAEEDYSTPIDYKDILFHYKTPSDCIKYTQEWLEPISAKYSEKQKSKQEYAKKVSLVADLHNISLGEYLAENEEDTLGNYFIETPYFQRILNGEPTIIVGNKGSGKTANLLMAANLLKEDKRNLVCVIKPLSYDVQGVVRLSKLFKERDKKGYVSEALWKYLIYSEIATTTYDEVKKLPYVDPNSPEDKLIKLMELSDGYLKYDFAVRLERCVKSILSSKPNESLQDFRGSISENLHEKTLRELRELLGELLTNRQRVIILIDNLDKAWDRTEDIDYLSDFLFGLISVTNSIPKEFTRKDHWRKPINLSITIFIRNDIFSRIMKQASEPDKIQYDRLSWDDPQILIRILDERLITNSQTVSPESNWKKYFCPKVGSTSSRNYLLNTILPRPRDLVFFAKVAFETAVNRGHSRIEEEDIFEAEYQYSQFIFEVVQVENGISLPELETLMFEFVGHKEVYTEEELYKIITLSSIEDNRKEYALRHLVTLSFLGMEVQANNFRYCSNIDDIKKIERLAKRYSDDNDFAPRYKIHKAFQAYLEITK